MENSVEKFKIYVDDLIKKFYQKMDNIIKVDAFNNLEKSTKNGKNDFLTKVLNQNSCQAKVPRNDMSLLEIEEILTLSDEEWQNYKNRIFNNYSFLSQLLKESHLKAKDIFNVLMWFIKRDTSKVNTIGVLISEKEYFRLKPKDMTVEDFTKFLDANYCKEIVKKPDVTKEELDLVSKILDFLNQYHENSPIFTFEKAIVRHYIEKDKITNRDIKIILKSLKGIGVEESLLITINNYLVKQIKKEPIKEEVVIKKNTSTYNYNELANLVNDFIDFTKMMPKRYLNLEERIYCLSILTKMNIAKEDRRLFLRNCDLLSCDIDIVTKYIEGYNRLKYYEEQVGLQKEIVNMEEIFQELFICNKEDYTFWKSSLEELMKQVECWIPKNFEYEENEVSRLLEK